MNHEECAASLIDHHYGELSPNQDRQVAEHLAGCERCAIEFCRLRVDLAGFATLSEASPGPETAPALRSKVEAEFGSQWNQRLRSVLSRRVPAYQPLLALAAAALVIVLAWPADEAPAPAEAQTVFEEYDAAETELPGGRIL